MSDYWQQQREDDAVYAYWAATQSCGRCGEAVDFFFSHNCPDAAS